MPGRLIFVSLHASNVGWRSSLLQLACPLVQQSPSFLLLKQKQLHKKGVPIRG